MREYTSMCVHTTIVHSYISVISKGSLSLPIPANAITHDTNLLNSYKYKIDSFSGYYFTHNGFLHGGRATSAATTKVVLVEEGRLCNIHPPPLFLQYYGHTSLGSRSEAACGWPDSYPWPYYPWPHYPPSGNQLSFIGRFTSLS